MTIVHREVYCLSKPKYVGVSRLLMELKHPFNLVTLGADLTPYKVIIIPDDFTFDSCDAKIINCYLAKGGKVISSGVGSLTNDLMRFALDGYDFIDFCGIDIHNNGYFKFDYDTNDSQLNSEMWAEYTDGIIIKTTRKLYNASCFLLIMVIYLTFYYSFAKRKLLKYTVDGSV